MGINLHKIATYDQKASVNGTNTNGIDQYFEYYADGLDFENLPLYDDETISEVYKILGDENGYGAQQAFLGYQSYIVNPFNFENGNTQYYSNVEYNQVNHQLSLNNDGWHRKTSFNVSGLYRDIFHIGVNINSHNLKFSSTQNLLETEQSLISPTYDINFNNKLLTLGNGTSVQIGGILRLKNIRLGATYDSPQWLTMIDETSQSIQVELG